MKRFNLLLFCMTAFCCASLFAQNDKNADAMMKAWMAYMTPSDMHKEMAKSEGVWNTTTSMWMDPNGQPMTSTGTCTNKMIMGGRYLESTFAGDFMGRPMQGRGTLGYDNAKKVFQSTWIDNMGTGTMMVSGPWNDATSSIEFTGTSTDPTSGKDIKVRQTWKIIDDKNQLMTMYMTPDGMSEFKGMEIKFTRK